MRDDVFSMGVGSHFGLSLYVIRGICGEGEIRKAWSRDKDPGRSASIKGVDKERTYSSSA